MTLYYSQANKSFLNTICWIDIEITSESHGRISFECTFLEFAAAKTGKISLFYRKVRYIERVFQFGDYNLVRYIEKFVIPKFAIPRVWIIRKSLAKIRGFAESSLYREVRYIEGTLYRELTVWIKGVPQKMKKKYLKIKFELYYHHILKWVCKHILYSFWTF